VTAVDDVLHRIQSYIDASVDKDGNPPPPVKPDATVIDTGKLAGT
jgi:hypothetical protein